MSATGRRLVAIGNERVEVESFAVPKPGPGQVLVRVSRSQVSGGTETLTLLGLEQPHPQGSLGYIAVGRVLSAGAGMEAYPQGPSWNQDLEDNPHPYWPWTRQRNRAAVMRMVSMGDLKVDHLVSHVVRPEEANEVYRRMVAGPEGWMGGFFDWDDDAG